MQVIRPLIVTDGIFTSSIPEPDASVGEVAWNAATAYNIGDEAVRTTTHRVYRRLVAGTTATAPENDPTNWADARPTNRWAMFDESVGTLSIDEATAAQVEVVIEPGQINSLALLELSGTMVTVTARDSPGGAIVYGPLEFDLELSLVDDWYMYFFEPFAQRETLVISDIPTFSTLELTVTIDGTGSAAVGQFVVGTVSTLGSTEYGLTAGIRDYSKKQVDEDTGIVTLERRRFAKLLRARFLLNEGAVNVVHKILQDLRSTPCVWIADNGGGFDPLVVYGFYRDFTLELQQAKRSYYSLEIEGMS